MAHKRNLIEIRLDRRQAFYAVVGTLLVVSVAFVVGLIVGQRMQLADPGHSERVAEDLRGDPGPEIPVAPEETVAEESESFTFYDELSAAPPRPLLMPSSGGIGEPAETYRILDRTPAGASDQEEEPEPPPAEEPPAARAASEPPAAPAEPLADREPASVVEAPAPQPVAEREEPVEPTPRSEPDPAPAEDDEARPQRRLVRVSSSGDGPVEDFGYYTVVAGRFPAFGEANDLRNRLRQAGHDAIVTIVSSGGPDREYRVQIGSFTRRSEADAVAHDLARSGVDASVVQEG